MINQFTWRCGGLKGWSRIATALLGSKLTPHFNLTQLGVESQGLFNLIQLITQLHQLCWGPKFFVKSFLQEKPIIQSMPFNLREFEVKFSTQLGYHYTIYNISRGVPVRHTYYWKPTNVVLVGLVCGSCSISLVI